MSFIGDWADILQSLEEQRKKYGGTSIGDSAVLAVTGKGFRFPDEATAKKIVENFKDSLRSIERRRVSIRAAQECFLATFSPDGASTAYRDTAFASFRALYELNESAARYAEKYIGKIERARKQIALEEEAGEDDARRIARSTS